MSEIAIKVEHLSKSYLVGHNAAQAERYTALRDVIARNARNLARKTRDHDCRQALDTRRRG